MWQMYGHEFLTLALIHFMAVILPGPDFVITVRQSVRYGYLIGCLTAIGIGVGISVH
ncbi:TPA: LysE family translocator, partial [Acinetobacter baumannii]